MPAYWLIKSEPTVYPFEKLVAEKKTAWEGVRNFEARNNLRAMKKGDLALYYHSQKGKEIVGVARVVREAYPDPTSEAGEEWSAVDFAPEFALKKPVTLADIKASKKLSKMALVKKSRVSVVPVTKDEYDAIVAAATAAIAARRSGSKPSRRA